MRFENGSIVELLACAEGKQLVVYGDAPNLHGMCKLYSSFGLWERIDLITDRVTRGEYYTYEEEQKPLIAFDKFCASLSSDSQCVILFTGADHFVTCELNLYTIPDSTIFYIGEFLMHTPPPYDLYQYKSDTQQIPKILHYCWFGGNPMKPMHHKCLESWRRFCPDYEIIEWNEENFDVHQNSFVSEAYQAKKWAFVSDFARLDVLYRFGGLYADTDVEILRPIDHFLYDTGFIGLETLHYPATGLLCGAVAGHEAIKLLRDVYETESFINPDGSHNTITNGNYAKVLLSRLGLSIENKLQRIHGLTIYPTDVFAPIHATYWWECFTDKTHAVHYFDWSWGEPERIRNKLEIVKGFREKLSKFSETPIYHFPVMPLPDSPIQSMPPEMWQTFPEAADLLYQEHYEEALDVLERYLAAALEAGSVSDAEYVLANQLFVAAIWGNEPLTIDIRAMRLELFVKSGQQERAEKEFSALQARCNAEQLQSIKELTGFA